MNTRAELFSWEPGSGNEISQEVSTAEEVSARAADLMRRYQGNKYGEVPGMTLQAKDSSRGSMEIAVAPIGWSLTITSEDHLTQYCTASEDVDPEPSIPVRWDEQTLVPRDRFISAKHALEGVEYWLETGGRISSLRWLDDCS